MSDSEDEVQDWRTVDARVLKRGEKDHAPDGTLAQQSVLQQSRESMYTALARPASCLNKHIVECDWDPVRARGSVRSIKGNYFTTMGWSESVNTYVWPEEIIYLVQRGSMVCYYENIPQTMEAVMALTLKHVSFEKLHVYSYLKRLGYVVRRAPALAPQSMAKPPRKPQPNLWARDLVWYIAGSRLDKLAWKPFYTSYLSVYRDLQWVKQRPFRLPDSDHTTQAFDFYGWKPSTKFRRSAPPAPDFRFRIVSADDDMPDLRSLESGFQQIEISESTKNTVVTRMREGVRHFVYAVVDNGVIGFVKAAEPVVECIV